MEAVLENKHICRICLKVLDSATQSFGYIEDDTGTLKEMLFCCIPELDIYVSTDPIVCLTCIQTLVGMYNFKTKCVNTETIIRSYMRRHNLVEYSHVNLTCVVQDLLKQNNIKKEVQQKPDDKPDVSNETTLEKEKETKDTPCESKIAPELSNQESNSSNQSTISRESSDSNEVHNAAEDNTSQLPNIHSPSHVNSLPPLVFPQIKSTDSMFNPMNQKSALPDSVPFQEDPATSQKVSVPSQLDPVIPVVTQADPMCSQMIPVPSRMNQVVPSVNSKMSALPSLLSQVTQAESACSQMNLTPSHMNLAPSQMNYASSQMRQFASQVRNMSSQHNSMPHHLNHFPDQGSSMSSQMGNMISQMNQIQMDPMASQRSYMPPQLSQTAGRMDPMSPPINPISSHFNQVAGRLDSTSRMSPLQSHLSQVPGHMDNMSSNIVHRQQPAQPPHLVYYRHYSRPSQNHMVNNTENSRSNEMQHTYGIHNHLNERNNFIPSDFYEGKMSYNNRAHMETFHPYGARIPHMFQRAPHIGHHQSGYPSVGHPQMSMHQMRPPQLGPPQHNRMTPSPHLQMRPSSPHVQMRPPSPHIQMRPPSPHIQMRPPSPHIQMRPPSPHIQMRPPSPQVQMRPPYSFYPRNSFEMDLRPPAPPPPPSPAPTPNSHINFSTQNTNQNQFPGTIQFKPYALDTICPPVNKNPPPDNHESISPNPFLSPIPAIESPVVPLSVHITSLGTLQPSPSESQNQLKESDISETIEQMVKDIKNAQSTEHEEQALENNGDRVSLESNGESLTNHSSESSSIESKLKLVIQLPRKIVDIEIKTEKTEPAEEKGGTYTEENVTEELRGEENQKVKSLDVAIAENIPVAYPVECYDNVYVISADPCPEIYQCSNCTFLTTNSDSLANHQELCLPNTAPEKTTKPTLKCPHCSHVTNRTYALNQHINTVHTKAIWYNCEKCSYKTTDKSCLRRHVRNVHSEKIEHDNLVCAYCSYKCTNEHNLRRHLMKHEVSSMQCEFCSYSTKDRSNFRKHLYIHNPKTTNCDFCDYKCGSPYQMRAHLKRQHNSVGIEDISCKSEQPLDELVREIGDAINEAALLKLVNEDLDGKMQLTPTGENSNSFLYECFKCSFSTPHTEDFIAHRENCEEQMKLPFQCPHCSHSSSSEINMEKHIKTAHSKSVKWLYCEHCSYKSTDRYNLNTHRNIRHHEKLACEQCDFTCVDTESFNKHLKSSHVMKRREFACKICDFKTNSESKLFNHNKNNKHTTTSARCEWCSYSTNDRANFRRHIFIHSPTKIECDFCDYKNVSPYQLIKHLKKYHSGVGIEDVDLRNTVPLTELTDDIRAAIKEASQIKI